MKSVQLFASHSNAPNIYIYNIYIYKHTVYIEGSVFHPVAQKTPVLLFCLYQKIDSVIMISLDLNINNV